MNREQSCENALTDQISFLYVLRLERRGKVISFDNAYRNWNDIVFGSIVISCLLRLIHIFSRYIASKHPSSGFNDVSTSRWKISLKVEPLLVEYFIIWMVLDRATEDVHRELAELRFSIECTIRRTSFHVCELSGSSSMNGEKKRI